MMPVPSVYSSKWVCVDANAVIDYIRECALYNLGMPPTGPKADALRIHLGQMSHVFVAETAGEEARQNLAKDIGHKLKNVNKGRVVATAVKLLRKYCNNVEVEDYLGYISAAQEMYVAINSDANNQKHSRWKKKKGRFIADPVLGSDTNDLIILSTAARRAQHYVVELWTHDIDFTMFADEIKQTFGVRVIDTYRLAS